MNKKQKGAILRWERSTLRKKELDLAKKAQERLVGQVKVRVDENTWVYVPKDKLEAEGKEFFIDKYKSLIQVRNRFENKTNRG